MFTRKCITVAVTIVVCLLGLCAIAFGQRTTATIFGSVHDSTGAVIPGAAVEISNELTGNVISLVSSEAGEFVANFLPVGRYTVKAEIKGFKPFQQKGIELTAAQQIRFPITMEIGQLTDTATVTAEAPLLQNASAALVSGFSRTQLEELPVSRRDFTGLLREVSGVKSDTKGLYTINGLASDGMSMTADGVDAAGQVERPAVSNTAGSNLINVMSLEAIQEVSTSAGAFSAEIGNTYSGNINLITKGGSNRFHGSLFENWQNDILNARYFFSASVPVVRFNQFGGSVGGPVLKNKVFFFFTYEGYRQSNQAPLSGLVPTPEWKAKAIAAVPAYKTFLDYFPSPTVSYNAATAASAQYYGLGANKASDNHTVARGDYQINSANLVTGRHIRMRPYLFKPVIPDAASLDQTGKNESMVLTWTHSASSWTSEMRLGVNYTQSINISPAISADYSTQVPLIAQTSLFTRFSGSHGDNFGHTYTAEYVVAKNLGRHTIKFGGIHGARAGGRDAFDNPIFTYNSANDMLANRPSQVRFTFGVPRYYLRTWQAGLFVQDDFRIRPNITLNLGVRYEYFSVITEKYKRTLNPGNPSNAEKIPPVFRPGDSLYNGDPNNLMPRVGIAWGLGKGRKTVVRGGFGMYVGPFPMQGYNSMIPYDYAKGIPFRADFTSQTDIANLKLYYPLNSLQAIQILSGNYKAPQGWFTFSENSPNPYSMQWSLDVQRQLTPNMVLKTGYVGNKGLKVTMDNDYNFPDRITGVSPVTGVLNYVFRDPTDASWYHAMQTSLRRRFSDGMSVNLNYTWAKEMAFSWGSYGANNRMVQDNKNIRADKGPGNNDRTHDLKVDGIYQLPIDRWLNAGGVLKRLIGGWQVASIFYAQSGVVGTVTQSSNRSSSRPDYVGGEVYLHPNNIGGAYLNKAAFALVPTASASKQTIRPGNVGKSTIRGPNTWGIDMNLAKSFAIREGIKLQVRLDAFNVLNHTNWGNPGTELTSSTFGMITTAGPSRSMQVAMRLAF